MPPICRQTWTRFSLDRTQLIFLSAFLLINVVLFSCAEHTRPYPEGPLISPTYQTAADGQRYWGVAINLASKGSFSVPPLWDSRSEYPLARSGPLTPIAFSLPIRLVGFDNAAALIVVFQCFFLYMMAFSARSLAHPFGVNPNIVQGLMLFNPNLIGLSHLAQSDLLFAGIFTLFLSYLTRVFSTLPNTGRSIFLTIGLFLGLLTLIRDLGFAVSLFFPIALFLTVAVSQAPLKSLMRTLGLGLLSGLLIYILVITPWSIRNHLVFGQLSPVVGQIDQLHYNYLQLAHFKSSELTEPPDKYIVRQVNSVLRDRHQEHCAIHPDRPILTGCTREVQKAYVISILSEPKLLLAKAVIYAATGTLTAGGSTRLIEYLGLDRGGNSRSSMESFSSLSSFRAYIFNWTRKDGQTKVLLVACFGFLLVTRIAGLVGIINAFYQRPHSRHHQLFHLLMVSFFLGIYAAVSTSRFRAPLEPILMLYAAIGLECVVPNAVRRAKNALRFLPSRSK